MKPNSPINRNISLTFCTILHEWYRGVYVLHYTIFCTTYKSKERFQWRITESTLFLSSEKISKRKFWDNFKQEISQQYLWWQHRHANEMNHFPRNKHAKKHSLSISKPLSPEKDLGHGKGKERFRIPKIYGCMVI